jgi:hypothetical protein
MGTAEPAESGAGRASEPGERARSRLVTALPCKVDRGVGAEGDALTLRLAESLEINVTHFSPIAGHQLCGSMKCEVLSGAQHHPLAIRGNGAIGNPVARCWFHGAAQLPDTLELMRCPRTQLPRKSKQGYRSRVALRDDEEICARRHQESFCIVRAVRLRCVENVFHRHRFFEFPRLLDTIDGDALAAGVVVSDIRDVHARPRWTWANADGLPVFDCRARQTNSPGDGSPRVEGKEHRLPGVVVVRQSRPGTRLTAMPLASTNSGSATVDPSARHCCAAASWEAVFKDGESPATKKPSQHMIHRSIMNGLLFAATITAWM